MHNGNITSLKIIEFDSHLLVTCGNDERVKIWNEDILLCDCNINVNIVISLVAPTVQMEYDHIRSTADQR